MTTTIKHSFLKPATSVNDSLLMTVFIAAVIHVIILLSIKFSAPEPQKVSAQIEVTLANSPSKRAPKKAEYLAQENQIGGGDEMNKPDPLKQTVASWGSSDDKLPDVSQPEQESTPNKVEKLITQQQADYKIAEIVEGTPLTEELERPKISLESLRKQMVEVGEEKFRESEKNSENNKDQKNKAVSTHKYIGAQYIRDWEAKIVRIADVNTPPKISKSKIKGKTMMRLELKADGSIHSMTVLKSSGSIVFDDYTKRIARLGAPYPRVRKELLNEKGVFSIIRKWTYNDESFEAR